MNITQEQQEQSACPKVASHTQFEPERLQAVVDKVWQLRYPEQTAPKVKSYQDFTGLIPVMRGDDYGAVARAAFARHAEKPVMIGGTSGTTGESKLVLGRTNTPGSRPTEDDIQLITELRMLGALNPGDVVVNLFMVGLFSILHHGFNRLLEACYCSIIPIGMLNQEQEEKQLKFMAACGVNVLVGTPGTLIQVAHAVRKQGISLNIKRILFTGERMGEAKATVLRSVFPGVRIIGCYGLSECGFVAIEQANGRYRVRENAYFLEQDQSGRLLVTCLDAELPAPILRYDTGDEITFVQTGSATYLHNIDRADTSFNFVGNLVDVKKLRQAIADLLGRSDVILEVELNTDSDGRDDLLVRVLVDTPVDGDLVLDYLCRQEELKEALEKGAGNIRVEQCPPEQAKLSGRNKHRHLIDNRN